MSVRHLTKLTSLFAASSLLVLGAACSLPLSSEDVKATNTCTSDAECGTHGACVAGPSQGRVCAATQADLGPVILEVRPASDSSGVTVSQVFTDKLDVSGTFAQGALETVDLQIPQNVTFAGEFLSPTVDPACTGDDGSLPVHVELRSVSPFANLSSTYKGDSKPTTDADGRRVHRYSVDVPAGIYDVYLAPADLPAGCAASTLPPRLISGQPLLSKTEFKPDAMAPLELSGSIIVPDATDVSGWRLEVVDPDYGLVLSDTARLSSPPVGGISQILGGVDGTDPNGVRYFYKKSAVIRLRDATGKLVVHWSLDPLDPTMVKLNLADLVANTQTVEASVVDANTQPVLASVRIQSVKLTGNANQNASFRVDTDTDAGGKIHADLVEGTYRVSVSPKDQSNGSATLVEDWEVKGNLGFGHAFVLPQRPSLLGSVVTPNGQKPLGDVPILASPVVSSPSYITTVFNPADALPRQSASQTDAGGAFQMLVDPGTVDFAVQPTADTGFSWLVVPRLLVTPAAQKPQAQLGALTMAAPVFVSGSVSSLKGGVVPSAVVRAWLPIADASQTGTQPTPLLQIGEAVTDDSGHFVLPLPPSISFTAPSP